MRYGAMNFPIRPVADEIEAIGAMGFDYCELAMDAPEGHFSKLEEQQDKILKVLDRHGMSLICHLPTFIHSADPTESIREASRAELLNSLSLASQLGARKAVIHPSFVGGLGRSLPESSRRYTIETLDAAVNLGQEKGCRLCLENLFYRLTPFTTPDDFADYFQRWPHLAMTLDIGHAFIDGHGMGRILDFIHRFGERIAHLHISDNFGHRDDHLPVGDGDIDFHTLIKALQRISYDDTMTLEIFTPDPNDLLHSRSILEEMLGPAGRRRVP